MKKQRMTADNVEQLMEIVRALQQGEEPDPKKRKKAAAEEGTDAFEQSLQDDRTEEDFAKGKEAVSSAVSKAAGLLGGIKEKQKQRREEQAKKREEEKAREEQRRAEENERAERQRADESERVERQRTEENERTERQRAEENKRTERRAEESEHTERQRVEESERIERQRAEEDERAERQRVEESERIERQRAKENECTEWQRPEESKHAELQRVKENERKEQHAAEITWATHTNDESPDELPASGEWEGLSDDSAASVSDSKDDTRKEHSIQKVSSTQHHSHQVSLASLFHSKERKEKKHPQNTSQDDAVFELNPAELPVASGVELDPDELAASGLSKSEIREYEKKHQQPTAPEHSKKQQSASHEPEKKNQQQDAGDERRRLNHLERSLLNKDDDEPNPMHKTDAQQDGAPAENVVHRGDVVDEATERANMVSSSKAKSLENAASGEDRETEKQPRKNTKAKEKKKISTRETDNSLSGMLSEIISGTKSGCKDLMEELAQKGIQSRELVMLGAVALFVVLLVLIAVNTVRNTVEQNQKSRNVTADEGLVITVEDEPSAWCSSYPVRLKVYVKRETVTSVSVNGSSYTPDEDGMITVNADNWVLDAEVKTESATRSARIEIAYLDGDAPVLEVKKEGNQIALVAVDARSDVEGIYYAATSEEAYSQMPYYQKYTEPLSYEEGTVYRFYAKDKAGNCSTPVVSTMDTAQSFSLNQTEVSLYPGETFGLSVTAEPEGALLENIRYESMDESVATVEQNGKVTAVGNGTAAIRVTADMLESQICTVTVSNERTITISAIGDCTLGTDENFNTSTNFDAFDAVNGHSYFFQNVSSILSQDDITFANFEGTLTDSTSRASKEYAFKGDASYTDILNLGSVEVVTLANNHSSDYGEESLTDTEQALTDAGIDYCNGDTIVIREVNGVKTAFIGIYVLDIGMERESQVKETIARAQKQGAQLIIVAFHWGTEKSNYPDETQTSLAHTAIDCGADLVVGHHPHVLQGIEKYNGKYIVYSLGNFCFGGNSSPSDMDTIIFQQTFTVSASGVLDTDEINIIPCKISSASGYNNYQPAPASGTDAEEIISRLNEYSAAYGQTYTAADIQ